MKAVCGLDVHKDSIYLCILRNDGELFEQVFGVLTVQLEEMRKLLQKHHVSEVCMESTGIYWIPIWRVLSPYFFLRLVNPYFIKQLPGHKSDVKDAQWIAECSMKELVSGSFVPPEIIQQLRQYDRRIFDLNEEIARKVSKVDGVLQRCNIRLSNYVSNIEGKSYRDVVHRLSEGVTDPNELIKFVHGRIVNRHGTETISESHRNECQAKMLEICEKHFPDELKHLQTIPGIKERAATSLIAEIGTDMSKFETANHLASWSGLRPRNDESNKKIKSRKITHGNVYLRNTIIQCAWAASRQKDCFFSRFSYHQTVVRRKNKMKVIVAVARKLLVAVWHVLHDKTDYIDFKPRTDCEESAGNG